MGGDETERRRWDASGRVVCDMLGNGCGAGGMAGMVGFWMGWGGLSFPRLSPALKRSVFPPLSPSLRPAGPRSGNKTG